MIPSATRANAVLYTEDGMVKIVRVSADAMLPQAKRAVARKALSPAQAAIRQFEKMVRKIDTPADVFEVAVGNDDQPITVRQRLLRAAALAGKEVAVRKSPRGFYVGLMTPERRSNRGRKSA